MDSKLETRMVVGDLIARSAALIDEDRLEEWIDLFSEDDCTYQVITKDNYDRDLKLSLIHCDCVDMLKDRILSLREANIYNPHNDRHIVSDVQVLKQNGSAVETSSSFAIFQTDCEGYTKLFCTGKYLDKIDIASSEPRLQKRVAVIDTWAIDTLLATPV